MRFKSYELAEIMLSNPYPSKRLLHMPVVTNVGMHLNADFDQNIPCGSRVMSIFTNLPRADGRTDSHRDYSADPRVVQ